MTFSLHILKYSIVYTMHYILYCAKLHAVQGNMLSNPSDPVYMEMTFSLHVLKYSIVYTIHYILYCAKLHAVQGNMFSNPSDPVYSTRHNKLTCNACL